MNYNQLIKIIQSTADLRKQTMFDQTKFQTMDYFEGAEICNQMKDAHLNIQQEKTNLANNQRAHQAEKDKLNVKIKEIDARIREHELLKQGHQTGLEDQKNELANIVKDMNAQQVKKINQILENNSPNTLI